MRRGISVYKKEETLFPIINRSANKKTRMTASEVSAAINKRIEIPNDVVSKRVLNKRINQRI